jgi:predicted Holliday junction resolvase-like endonuclease
MFVLILTVLLNLAVSLANALNRVKTLEGKLSANTKALKEAERKRAEEVVATKLSAAQAVREAEARAIKFKK